MGGVNEGGDKFANNLVKMLSGFAWTMVKKDINFTIKHTIAYKVVVCRVQEWRTGSKSV